MVIINNVSIFWLIDFWPVLPLIENAHATVYMWGLMVELVLSWRGVRFCLSVLAQVMANLAVTLTWNSRLEFITQCVTVCLSVAESCVRVRVCVCVAQSVEMCVCVRSRAERCAARDRQWEWVMGTLATYSTPLYTSLLLSTPLYSYLHLSTPLYSSKHLSLPFYTSWQLFAPL